jgi:hypothetical protein
MAAFPKLSTGAFAQYGAGYELAFRTQVIRYVDGSEQRYPVCGAPGRRWMIALRQLTPKESAEVLSFFSGQRGREGTFTFTDPWTGLEHPSCCFDADGIRTHVNDELNASTSLVIREVNP